MSKLDNKNQSTNMNNSSNKQGVPNAKKRSSRNYFKRPNNYRETMSEYKKPSRKQSTDFAHCMQRDADNDPRWHIHSEQLARDVASLPFSTMVGDAWSTSRNWATLNASPGIFTFHMDFTFGSFSEPSDAINMAAFNEYSFIRHANSGHSNYDAPDLMLYLLAMDSIYAIYSHCMRIYGLMRFYSIQNRYVPARLMQALGVAADEADGHNLVEFRTTLNMLAYKIGTRAVPTTFDLYKRHIWMFSNVYKDENMDRYQLYAYVPSRVYQFDLDSSSKAGMLRSVGVPPTLDSNRKYSDEWNPKSLSTWTTFLANLVNSLYQQESAGIMSGDIMKAYGDKLFHIPLIPEEYSLQPEFSEEVLSQMQNTNSFGQLSDPTANLPGNDIKQSTAIGAGALYSGPIVQRTEFFPAPSFCSAWLLNMHKEHPTADDILVATANTTLTNVFDDDNAASLGCVGADYCSGFRIWQGINPNLPIPTQFDSFTGFNPPLNAQDCLAYLKFHMPLEAFYRHPLLWIGTLIETVGGKQLLSPNSAVFFDQENVQEIASNTLKLLHQTRVMSMLNLPEAN